MNHIASLDLLRGVAAFAVAIPHYLLLSGSQSDAAEVVSILAVEVFFTLSGFVLAPQILACMRSQRLRDLMVFLMRRWMRTIPPFVFALVSIAMLSGQLLTADMVRYLAYAQNLFAQHNQDDFFPVAWSLSIEEWFYVVFPALIFFLYRWLYRDDPRFEVLVALGFIAAVTIARMTFGDQTHWGAEVRRVVVFRIDSIAYGFLFYLLIGRPHVGEHVEITRGGNLGVAVVAFLLAATVAAASAWQIGFGHSTLAQQLFPFAAAGLGVSAIYLLYCIGIWLERKPVFAAFGDFVGKISYSTYLFHIIAAQLLHQRLQSWPIAIQLVAFVSILVAFCSVFYIYFERPILAARPSYGRGAKRPTLAQAS
jgi:peptidoglycan/LPS O-acetylase OafA/YrhL